ncbi:MAG: hypothetical protein ACI9CA_001344 [Natronomonas sp.]|jgi:hypothetical protein
MSHSADSDAADPAGPTDLRKQTYYEIVTSSKA